MINIINNTAVIAASAAATASTAARAIRKEKEIVELEGQIGATINRDTLSKCLSVAEYPSASSAIENEGKQGFFEGWLISDNSQQRIKETQTAIQMCIDGNLINPKDKQGNPVVAKSGVIYEPLVNFNCNLGDICTPTAAGVMAPADPPIR